MKKFIIAFLALITFAQCKKEKVEGDLAGNEHIRGRLFLLDTLTQQAVGTPLKKKKITISYADSQDTLNYLYSTTTDDEGYFLFQNLQKDKIYRLYYEEKVGEILYLAKDTAAASTDQKSLTAQVAKTRQNGLHFTVTDASGGSIKGAKICVFSNPSVYSTGNCDASNFQLTTDDYGRASKLNIPQGVYYVQTTVSVNNVSMSHKDTIEIKDTISFKRIQLGITQKNGFTYTVMDANGSRVAGANLCVFTSQVLFDRDTCESSNFQVTSDVNGNVSKTDLQPGRYLVYGTLKVGNDIYFAKDTINVQNTMITKTLVLHKKQYTTNGFNYTVVDTLGTRVSGATLCVFTSQVLFNRDTCEGSNFQIVSDVYGNAIKTGIQPGRYLIYGNMKVGNDIYVAKDTIDVQNTVVNKTLMFRKKQ